MFFFVFIRFKSLTLIKIEIESRLYYINIIAYRRILRESLVFRQSWNPSYNFIYLFAERNPENI